MLDAANELTGEELNRDFGTADKSVLGTMVHTFGADRIWLRRVLAQETGGFPSPEERALPFLTREWPRIGAGWLEWVSQLGPEALLRPIDYRDMKGNAHNSLPWEIILHVVNHATHHRGQVAGFMRSMGKVPPPLDLIAFYRQRPR